MAPSQRAGQRIALVAVLLLTSGVLVPTEAVSVPPSTSDARSPTYPSFSQANPAHPPTRLDSCSKITRSGRYVLTSDVQTRTASCLRIAASDVVLDGRGHVVDGGTFRENTTGIEVTGRNVTVRNVASVNWTFGVRYENASAGTVLNVTTWRTGDGVTISESPRTRVERVTATNGFTGISVSNSDATRIADSVVRDTSSAGVFVADSRRVAVANVSIARSRTGIALLGVRNARVMDAVVRSTVESILLVDSRDNAILNATLTNPHGRAVVVRLNANGNRFVGIDGDWTFRDVPNTTTTGERGAVSSAPVG